LNETPEEAQGSDEPKQSVTTIYSRYRAYLLRIWQETPQMPWRASLQCTVTGQRRGFRDLESLFAFLEAEAEQRPQATNSEAHDSQEG
jgi:hypothetical protein